MLLRPAAASGGSVEMIGGLVMMRIRHACLWLGNGVGLVCMGESGRARARVCIEQAGKRGIAFSEPGRPKTTTAETAYR